MLAKPILILDFYILKTLYFLKKARHAQTPLIANDFFIAQKCELGIDDFKQIFAALLVIFIGYARQKNA